MEHRNSSLRAAGWIAAAFYLITSSLAAAEPSLVLSFNNEKLVFAPGDIVEAAVVFDLNNRPGVAFRMSAEKARQFGAMTANHIGEKVDLVVCGKVMSSPVIQTPLMGGSGMVSGEFTMEQAKMLAAQLQAGSCE